MVLISKKHESCIYLSPGNWGNGDFTVSGNKVRICVRWFKEGQENIHEESFSCRSFLIGDNLVHAVDSFAEIDDSEFSTKFPQLSYKCWE